MPTPVHQLHLTQIRARRTRAVREGATVTNVALQLAYFCGLQHGYPGLAWIIALRPRARPTPPCSPEGDDPVHFSAAYFGKGFRWQLPDLETSELAYRMAREAYESDGRQVLDATIGGKLQVFPKVAYASLFG